MRQQETFPPTSRVMPTLQSEYPIATTNMFMERQAFMSPCAQQTEVRCMTHRVFVYGTLKKGFWNNPLLKGCEFFGSAVTVPTYSMISVSHAVITLFPVIRP